VCQEPAEVVRPNRPRRAANIVMSALLVLLLAGCASSGCAAGVRYYRDDDLGPNWVDGSEAFVRQEVDTSYYRYFVGLSGSFLPKTEGTHQFIFRFHIWGATALVYEEAASCYFENETGSISVLDPDATQDSASAEDTWVIERYCYMGWRYSFRMTSDDECWNQELEISVILPGESTAIRLGADYCETCEDSGCADPALSRTPYSCKPPPTVSRTPTGSASPRATESFRFAGSGRFRNSVADLGSENFPASKELSRAPPSSEFTAGSALLAMPRKIVHAFLFAVADVAGIA